MTGPSVVSCEQPVIHRTELMERRDSLLAAMLLGTTLIVVFWGFLQLDLPLTRYLRSLHVPWLERAGDVGNRLGSGAILVGISGVVLVTGLLMKRPTLRAAGLQSLLAHGVTGLAAQALKHTIGRPRPRMVHGDNGFLFGPSLDSGLDSFPSGHASASFAVATVLARYFPKSSWMLYAMATLVALSRIVRGSHFPTDVMAGITLGLLAGCVIANPLRAWKRAFLQSLTMGAPFLVAAFGLTWIAVYPSFDQPLTHLMVISGGLALVIGMGLRLYRRLTARRHPPQQTRVGFSETNGMIVIGLALTTASTLVTMIAALVSLAYWVMHHKVEHQSESLSTSSAEPLQSAPIDYYAVLIELPLMTVVLLAALAIQQIKGILPLLP